MKTYDQLLNNNINFRTRELYFMASHNTDSDVTDLSSANLIKNATILDSINEEAITLHLMTDGGCVYSGLAIYDVLSTLKSHLTIICHGLVASMGAVILQAGDTRLMMPHSTLMLHEGSVALSGTHKQVMVTTQEYERIEDLTMQIFVKSCGRRGTLRKLSKENRALQIKRFYDQLEDVYLPPKTAVELGFADKILK